MLVMVWHLSVLNVPGLPWYDSVPYWIVLNSPFAIYLVCRSLSLLLVYLMLVYLHIHTLSCAYTKNTGHKQLELLKSLLGISSFSNA